MKILFLSRYGPKGASSRLRLFQFLPLLKLAGIECTTQYLFDDLMLSRKYERGSYSLATVAKTYWERTKQMIKRKHYDMLFIEKEALPWLPASFERVLLRGVPYVLDYDDALFHNYDLHSSLFLRCIFGKRIDTLMAGACLVLCGNNYLAQRARQAGAPWVEVLPTVIDLDKYKYQTSFCTDGIPRIVWIGSPLTVNYLKLIHTALISLSENFAFKLRLIGARVDLPGVDVEYIDWSEQTEMGAIQSCQVGVMPLHDGPWERGKCGYKLIQYMACGLPVVASPVGMNLVIVREGVNGLLASADEEWTVALETLLRDDVLRQRMGSAGRQRVEDEYCVQQVAPRLIQWLRFAGRS